MSELQQEVARILLEHAALYDKAEGVFKKLQLKENGIDFDALNKFRYCSRSQCTVLKRIAEGKVDYSAIMDELAPGTRAIKCVINDSVDALLVFSKCIVQKIEDTYQGCDFAVEYGVEKYLEFWRALQRLEEKVVESREARDSRVEIYLEMADGNDLARVIDFISLSKHIEGRVAAKHKRNTGDQVWSRIGIAFTALAAVATAATAAYH